MTCVKLAAVRLLSVMFSHSPHCRLWARSKRHDFWLTMNDILVKCPMLINWNTCIHHLHKGLCVKMIHCKCDEAKNHYLSHCWSRYMSPCGITRPKHNLLWWMDCFQTWHKWPWTWEDVSHVMTADFINVGVVNVCNKRRLFGTIQIYDAKYMYRYISQHGMSLSHQYMFKQVWVIRIMISMLWLKLLWNRKINYPVIELPFEHNILFHLQQHDRI